MATFLLPQNYGYVYSVLGSSLFMNVYMSYIVVSARKKYNVEYPTLYLPFNENDDEKQKKRVLEYNSAQRAHQNTLESYSSVMLLMALAGLKYPITSAACGGLFVFGRVLYAYGYASGGPKGRMAGGIISHLGDIPLYVICIKIGYDMITNA